MTDGPVTSQDSAAPREPEKPAQPDSREPAAPQAPATRPRPAYGELAPEGWEWKPESDTTPTQASTPQAVSAPAPGGAPASLPGVPHNLGAGLPKRGAKASPGTHVPGSGSNSGQPPAAGPNTEGSGTQSTGTQSTGTQGPATQGGPGSPYRAQAPAAAPAPVPAQRSPAPAQPGAPRPRIADRVITIGLLALGAFTTLSLTSALFALETQLRLTATMIGAEDATLAPWVGPLGTITGFAVLALFAVTLIFSIQRMRAGKLAFWVPLSAGVLAILIVMIVPTIAMLAGAPEIMQQLEADPQGSLDKMFKYAQQME